MRRAVLPGSFDPPTVGHYDLARRAAAIFDEVYVVAFVNSAKKGRFTPEQRLELLRVGFADLPNVRVDTSSELLADYCKKRGIATIVKGARGSVDFDYELSLSLINRSLEPELDTVILPTRAELMHVSSTMVSEMIKYGREYAHLLPGDAAELVARYVREA